MSETRLDSPARTPASAGRGRGVLRIPASFLSSPVVGSNVALGVNRVNLSIGPLKLLIWVTKIGNQSRVQHHTLNSLLLIL